MSAAQQKMAVVGTSALAPGAPARPEAAPRRAPLAVVRAVPARRRAPFAIFCLGVLAAALVTVLVLNISVSTGQYQLVQLRNEQLTLQKQNQDLTQRVQNYEAPQNLAARAAQLGMVASTSKGQIDLGTLGVTGNAKAAQKGGGKEAAIAAPAVPGQMSVTPTPTSKDPLEARAQANAAAAAPAQGTAAAGAASPAGAQALNGGTIPAPAQREPGR
jgi:cell division protein FtsL